MIKQILKKKKLAVDDLNPDVLNARLIKLAGEKTENEWYRNEIETSQRDTADYIAYLESKKMEKVKAIETLTCKSDNDHAIFQTRKAQQFQKNDKQISGNLILRELKQQINELEILLSSKESEILLLSDTIAKRAKHESEMNKIKLEMEENRQAHEKQMAELEKKLLDTRLVLQAEAQNKISQFQSEAKEKAFKYLANHSASIESENIQLSNQLNVLTRRTNKLILERDVLLQENAKLEREFTLREAMIDSRLVKIKKAVDKQNKRIALEEQEEKRQKQQFIASILEANGLEATPIKKEFLDKQQ